MAAKLGATSPKATPADARAARSPTSGVHLRVPVRKVLQHPHALLDRPCVEIDPVYPAIVELAAVLVSSMRATPGCVALSAPQIGASIRLFAIDVTAHPEAKSCAGLVVLANPRIVTRAGNIVMREHCASVPAFTGAVARAEEIIITGFVPGSEREVILTASGIEARGIQHAVDHLDGILFCERVQQPVAEIHGRRHFS